MPALVTFGRVLFAVLFMYTGATKLFAIQPTADFIASKVTIPSVVAPYTSQLETMTGMPMPLAVTVARSPLAVHAPSSGFTCAWAGRAIAIRAMARAVRSAVLPLLRWGLSFISGSRSRY